MSIKHITLSLSLLSTFTLYADINVQDEHSYLDNLHSSISDDVHTLSHSIDKLFSGSVDDQNTTLVNRSPYDTTKSVDSFFQTNKFLNETEKTFLRVNFNSLFQTKHSSDFKYKIRARIPLSRTKKNYNLFIEDIQENGSNQVLKDESINQSSSTAIGVNYFAAKTYGIKSKYSIGTSGFNPFVRARYNLNYSLQDWFIEPVQTFKYSSNRKFEEETNVYFDKVIKDAELLRLTLYRHTQENVKGMDYAFSAQYFLPLKSQTAISISQVFVGNTKYLDIPYGSPTTQSYNTYGGINDYITTVNYRENIWKKWFFYELSPGVNFHRQHDYKVNYSMRFSIDIYFGQTYKKLCPPN
ncbi:MAG: hypothetical protein ACI9TV_001699 [Sulfurimonas sp.]|jgi:hypothetical protein|uniref:hypothetical protein n=1 Tax=Sulfurimonas sp. TaxID=2022749 RepID=UPI0039E4ED0B